MGAESCQLTETWAPSADRTAAPLRHAVIYSAASGFVQEFYPLAVDAYVRDIRRHGAPRFQVLGVHVDWLDRAGCIRRAIALDPERDRLVEWALDPPVPPHSAQFLSLGRREQGLHHTLSACLRCPQVNPGTAAELADDKAATLAGWAKLGLRVPSTRRIDPGHAATAWNFIQAFGDCVVKPNDATEGLGVTFLSADSTNVGPLSQALDCAWRLGGTALIQQRRDGLLYRAPDAGTTHTLALRLNVVFDGRRHRVTSGFAQVGADAAQPASCGRGGRIVTLADALAHLVPKQPPAGAVAGLDESLWAEITDQAEQAAGLFGTLLLVGLDVILDVSPTGRVIAVFVEANPRPAGLCHARLLSGLPTKSDLPGVGLQLWDGLEAGCSAPRSDGTPSDCRTPAGTTPGA